MLKPLMKTSDDVDAVLWLAPAGKRAEGVRLALVTPQMYWYSQAETEHAADTLIDAFVQNREEL